MKAALKYRHLQYFIDQDIDMKTFLAQFECGDVSSLFLPYFFSSHKKLFDRVFFSRYLQLLDIFRKKWHGFEEKVTSGISSKSYGNSASNNFRATEETRTE